MSRSPPHSRIRRLLPRALAVAGALLLALVLWPDRVPDPSLEGRRTSTWFHRLLRYSAPPRTEGDDARTLEAQRALLRLGTNAVPWLVDRALNPAADGPLRRNLRQLARILEVSGLHPGRFPTPAAQTIEAVRLLRILRPPLELVAPLVRVGSGATGQSRSVAVEVLAACPDGGTRILPFVQAAPGDPRSEARFVWALGSLSPLPTEVLTYTLQTLPGAPVGSLPHARLLAAFGAAARAGRSWLEAGLAPIPKNPQPRIWSALALLEIEPDHPAATAVIRSTTEAPAFDSRNEFLKFDAALLCSAILDWKPSPRSAVTREVIEQLARQEVEGWTQRGMSLQACRALEHLDPSRAASLYLRHLSSNTPPEVRLVAAGAVLRTATDPSPALAVLQEALQRYDYPAVLAAQQLGEADPGFAPALELLRHAATHAFIEGARVEARTSLLRLEVRALEQAARATPPRPGP